MVDVCCMEHFTRQPHRHWCEFSEARGPVSFHNIFTFKGHPCPLSINSPGASSRGEKQLCFFADSPCSHPPSSQRGVCYESCGQLCCESHKKDIFHLSFFLLSLPLSLSIRQRFIPSLMPVACGAGRGQGKH